MFSGVDGISLSSPAFVRSFSHACVAEYKPFIIAEKNYAADDVLKLKRIYEVIAGRIPSAHLSELLKQCREAFQSYDLLKDKRDREAEKSEYGQLQPLDGPLDVSKTCKKRGKKHRKKD